MTTGGNPEMFSAERQPEAVLKLIDPNEINLYALAPDSPASDSPEETELEAKIRTTLRDVERIIEGKREEAKTRESMMLLDSLHTCTNHYVILQLLERIRFVICHAEDRNTLVNRPWLKPYEVTNNRPSGARRYWRREEYFDYRGSSTSGRNFVTPELFQAQIENIYMIETLDEKDRPTHLPVWIVGTKPVSNAQTEYLAAAIDHILPADIRNYTEPNYTIYGPKKFHAATAEGEPLYHAAEKQKHIGNHSSSYPARYNNLRKTLTSVLNQGSFGLITFTASPSLRPVDPRQNDPEQARTELLKRKHPNPKKIRYDARPTTFSEIATAERYNKVSDIARAEVTDLSMETFNVLGHLGTLADNYGLGDDLHQLVAGANEYRADADDLTWEYYRQSLGMKTLKHLSPFPKRFDIPPEWR